jgi:hypothetical protein
MNTTTPGHRKLLNILAQLACPVAMATTKEPHERVPEDLKTLMRALQQVDWDDSTDMSPRCLDFIVWTPALKFVAKHEPDLFPKTIARTMVYRLGRSFRDVRLWNIACTVDGLDLIGTYEPASDHDSYLRRQMFYRTPHVIELLIAPRPFGQILDAFEAHEREGSTYSEPLSCYTRGDADHMSYHTV